MDNYNTMTPSFPITGRDNVGLNRVVRRVRGVARGHGPLVEGPYPAVAVVPVDAEYDGALLVGDSTWRSGSNRRAMHGPSSVTMTMGGGPPLHRRPRGARDTEDEQNFVSRMKIKPITHTHPAGLAQPRLRTEAP